MEHERPFALVAGVLQIEQPRKRLPDQAIGIALQALGDGVRHIGQQRAAVGFPEPSLPGFLVIGENIASARLHSLDRFAAFQLVALLEQLFPADKHRHDRTDYKTERACKRCVDEHRCRPQRQLCRKDRGRQAAQIGGGDTAYAKQAGERHVPCDPLIARPDCQAEAEQEQRQYDHADKSETLCHLATL